MSEEPIDNEQNDDLTAPLDPSYAPANPTDSRGVGNWKTRYPKEANQKIKKEALYLGIILVFIPTLMLSINENLFGLLIIPSAVKKYSFAWLGGTLGGTLFSIKWLYHSVARFLWNEDRWLWRLYTPHISGALAFAFITLISSGIINIFSPDAVNKSTAVVGLSFLVGYFSDSAIAKLNEVAITIFGSTEKGKNKKEFDKPDEH